MTDSVNHPKHYNQDIYKHSHCGLSIECIDIVRHMSFNLGNAIKYIWRCNDKNSDIEDLKKAIFYLTDEIKLRSNQKHQVSIKVSEDAIE